MRSALLLLFLVGMLDAAKLRAWLGPTTFFEGPLPSEIMRLGFVSAAGGKIFEFGGQDSDGKNEQN